MAYDEGLAERIREMLAGHEDLVERRMFGGLCFMLSGHMCCGIVDDTLMARVGPDNYTGCLAEKHVREMDFTGRPLTGMVYVAPKGFESDQDLGRWLDTCICFVTSLPLKQPK
jgi:hypothetical protein